MSPQKQYLPKSPYKSSSKKQPTSASKSPVRTQQKNAPIQPSPQRTLNSSMKKVNDIVNSAMMKSHETRTRYESSQLRQFMNSLLNDEVFVPLNPSPTK